MDFLLKVGGGTGGGGYNDDLDMKIFWRILLVVFRELRHTSVSCWAGQSSIITSTVTGITTSMICTCPTIRAGIWITVVNICDGTFELYWNCIEKDNGWKPLFTKTFQKMIVGSSAKLKTQSISSFIKWQFLFNHRINIKIEIKLRGKCYLMCKEHLLYTNNVCMQVSNLLWL